mmetsp:Transcript_83604/g.263990  ORF Transcript_83604/g.263990 Transcript_83604/m.263990 type:complete len:280 (-) Transcript_83604:36-875(-)
MGRRARAVRPSGVSHDRQTRWRMALPACSAAAWWCFRGGSVGPADVGGQNPVRRATVGAADAVTGAVNTTAGVLRNVGEATAATLGATLRITGGAVRGLGRAVDAVGEAQVVRQGPMAAPSRVIAGLHRVLAVAIAGVGDATVGLGGTVEDVAVEASRLLEDSVNILAEPTRRIGDSLRVDRSGQFQRRQRRPGRYPAGRGDGPRNSSGAPGTDLPAPPQSYVDGRNRVEQTMSERIARRCLREALGNPSERMVSLAPPLSLALLAAWLMGRGCGGRRG